MQQTVLFSLSKVVLTLKEKKETKQGKKKKMGQVSNIY